MPLRTATAGEYSGVQSSLLRRNLFWTLTGNVVYVASQWLVLLVIARLGTPYMVGQLAMGFAWTGPIFLLSQLRLRALQATDGGGEYSTGDYLGLRILTTALVIVLAVLFASWYGLSSESGWVVIGVALAKSFESGSDILYGLFQQQEEMQRMAWSMIARGVLSVTSVGLTMAATHNIVLATAALAGSSLLLLLFFDIPFALAMMRKRQMGLLTPRWNWPTLSRLALTAAPLGVSAMLMSWGTNVPRYFLEHYNGIREVGVFSAVFYVAMASGYLVTALGEAANPAMGRLFAAGMLTELREMMLRLILCTVLVGAVLLSLCALWGGRLLAWIYGAEYAVPPLLLWLAIAAMVANLASILSYGLIATRRLRAHLGALIVMLLVTASLCQWLAPEYGSLGVAWALLVAYFGQTAYSLWAMRHTPAEATA